MRHFITTHKLGSRDLWEYMYQPVANTSRVYVYAWRTHCFGNCALSPFQFLVYSPSHTHRFTDKSNTKWSEKQQQNQQQHNRNLYYSPSYGAVYKITNTLKLSACENERNSTLQTHKHRTVAFALEKQIKYMRQQHKCGCDQHFYSQ